MTFLVFFYIFTIAKRQSIKLLDRTSYGQRYSVQLFKYYKNLLNQYNFFFLIYTNYLEKNYTYKSTNKIIQLTTNDLKILHQMGYKSQQFRYAFQ